ncbi:MAG: ribbon-helix-helix protein, CopG family, partial [bacterium]
SEGGGRVRAAPGHLARNSRRIRVDLPRESYYHLLPGYYREPLMKSISLKLPDEVDLELTSLAERKGVTKSALIREALEGYLTHDPGRKRLSFLERAGDLIGCVEGPGDLSYNKEYMKDYGQ